MEGDKHLTVTGDKNEYEIEVRKCYNKGDFRKYFEENMKALGLSTPDDTWFATYEKAVAVGAGMSAYLWQYGPKTTILEMVKVGLTHEKW